MNRTRIKAVIAKQIKNAREEAGLTQPKLAEAMGVTQPMIGYLESSKDRRIPSIEVLDRVAKATKQRLVIADKNFHLEIGSPPEEKQPVCSECGIQDHPLESHHHYPDLYLSLLEDKHMIKRTIYVGHTKRAIWGEILDIQLPENWVNWIIEMSEADPQREKIISLPPNIHEWVLLKLRKDELTAKRWEKKINDFIKR